MFLTPMRPGFFYKLKQNKTLQIKVEKCFGSKKSKDQESERERERERKGENEM